MADSGDAGLVPPQAASIALTPPQGCAETSALIWAPATPPSAVVVLGHGAGSTKSAPILGAVGQALSGAGVATLAFNFAYAEMGRRAPDPMPRLLSAYRDAIAVGRALAPGRRLLLGGRSMGGRVGTMLAADGVDTAGLLLLGYPLHPPGRPDRLRIEHWPKVTAPLLFVSGTRDTFFTLDLFAQHRELLAGEVTLHLLEGADHGFKVRKADGRTNAEVLAEVCDVSVRWVTGITG